MKSLTQGWLGMAATKARFSLSSGVTFGLSRDPRRHHHAGTKQTVSLPVVPPHLTEEMTPELWIGLPP